MLPFNLRDMPLSWFTPEKSSLITISKSSKLLKSYVALFRGIILSILGGFLSGRIPMIDPCFISELIILLSFLLVVNGTHLDLLISYYDKSRCLVSWLLNTLNEYLKGLLNGTEFGPI